MLTAVIRFVQRGLVLIPLIVVAYLSTFRIFPWLEDHSPLVVAIVVTYALVAYAFVPGVMRLVHLIWPPKHVPLYCVTPDGFASDPLNIALVGTREEVRAAMKAAGWHEADPLNLRTGLRLMLSTVYGWRYLTGPMSSLFLFGRRQDLSFQLPVHDGTAGHRHHVRFWATTYRGDGQPTVRTIDWQGRSEHVRHDRLLWLGAASRDIGVTFIRHNAQLTHLVDPDTDVERDFMVEQFTEADLVAAVQHIALDEPYRLHNIRGWVRRYLHTDGRLAVVMLKPAKHQTVTSRRGSLKRKP